MLLVAVRMLKLHTDRAISPVTVPHQIRQLYYIFVISFISPKEYKVLLYRPAPTPNFILPKILMRKLRLRHSGCFNFSNESTRYQTQLPPFLVYHNNHYNNHSHNYISPEICKLSLGLSSNDHSKSKTQ